MTDQRIGQRGSAEIEWHNGRRIRIEGDVVAIVEPANEVYLDTEIGAAVGDLSTLEMDGDEYKPRTG